MADKGVIAANGVWMVDDKPVKVDKWDGTAVKNMLDDAVKKILIGSHGYVESNRLMDLRLFICTISVLFALLALVWDYLRPFPESKSVLMICVGSYFVLMIVLTLYVSYIERSTFLVALQRDPAGLDPDSVWQARSFLKRYDDMYTLEMDVKDSDGGALRTASFTKSIADFLDENGVLCFDLFQVEVDELHDSLGAEKKTE